MAYPTIVFNASTGSDTAASGAGPATAEAGTGASLNATTSVDLSADSPDLSGVATDGSACLWVQTSSGRQFSKITATDNSTKIVTVETAYSVTESSRTWAIGGKRATWDNADSRQLFADWSFGWVTETETNQTVSSSIVIVTGGSSTSGQVTIKGSSGSRKVVTQTSNNYCFHITNPVGYVTWENLKIQNSNGTKTLAHGIANSSAGDHNVIINCEIGDSINQLRSGLQRITQANSWIVINSWIHHCTDAGVYQGGAAGNTTICGSIISDNTSHGIFDVASTIPVKLINSIFTRNGGAGASISNAARPTILNCVFHDNGQSGLSVSSTCSRSFIVNNIFVENGQYGIDAGGSAYPQSYIDYNNFGIGATANISGPINGLSLGDNTLTVDPQFTDANGNDFTVGTNLKATGWPNDIGYIGTTFSYVDIGAAQRQESAAGGGVRIPNIRGGADQ